MTKLTDNESQLVSDNHNLIYWYARLKNLDIDEWYDILAIELCETIQRYNSDKGKLSSFFMLRANNRVSNEFRLNNRLKRKGDTVSLDDDEHKLHVWDKYSTFSENDYIEQIRNDKSIDSVTKEIIIYKLKGHTQVEISTILNIQQPRISKLMSAYKKVYMEGMNNE